MGRDRVQLGKNRNAGLRVVRWMALLLVLSLDVAACRGELVALEEPSPSATSDDLGQPTPALATSPPTATPAPSPVTAVVEPSPTGPPTAVAPSPAVRPVPTPVRSPVPRPVTSPAATPTPVASPTATPLPTATPTPVISGYCDLAVDQVVFPGPVPEAQIVTVTVQHVGNGSCPQGAQLAVAGEGVALHGPVRWNESGDSAGWECSDLRCVASREIRPGYAATMLFVASVPPGASGRSCARVMAEGDGQPANDEHCTSLTSPAQPTPVACSFGLEKTVTRQAVPGTAGFGMAVTITLVNSGPSECQPSHREVTVVDELPLGFGVEGVQVSGPAGWACGSTEQVVRCSGPAPGTGERVIVAIRVGARDELDGAINCALVEPLGIQACAAMR